jgi:hypothetical protein
MCLNKYSAELLAYFPQTLHTKDSHPCVCMWTHNDPDGGRENIQNTGF